MSQDLSPVTFPVLGLAGWPGTRRLVMRGAARPRAGDDLLGPSVVQDAKQ